MTGEREATLEELLREPIIRQLMASDHVRSAEIRRLLRGIRVESPKDPQPSTETACHA